MPELESYDGRFDTVFDNIDTVMAAVCRNATAETLVDSIVILTHRIHADPDNVSELREQRAAIRAELIFRARSEKAWS